jgi:hypothetical protein
MKIRKVNLQVFGMMDLLTAVFGDKAEAVLEESTVFGNFTFGDCDYSLVTIEAFIDSFTGDAYDALWDEVKASLKLPAGDEILPEDVANLYVDLVG